MDGFWDQAQQIFSTARQGNCEDGQFAILVSAEGAIRMLTGEGWSLESLREHYGARAAYRVTRFGGRVRLEARCGSESCLLEAVRPAKAVSPLLADFPRYAQR